MPREHLFSVTLKDCDVQTFSAGGPGGQNQNRRSTGIRITHRESGAVGEARDTRSQLLNKRAAFKRMIETPKFKAWMRVKTGRDAHLRAEVERDMWPSKIRVEVREDGEWVEEK